MDRKPLGVMAVVIIAAMAFVATAGLDNLPKALKSSIDAAETRVSTDRVNFNQQGAAIRRTLAAEPDLFRSRTAGWQAQIAEAQTKLSSAENELAALKKLAKEDRREDTEAVEQGLARLESLRAANTQTIQQIKAETERWLGYKRDLPARLAAMNADYEALRSFDVEAATGPARKAMLDWPAKRPDLEQRLALLGGGKTRAEQIFNDSSAAREQAINQASGALDYAAVFSAADQLDALERQTREGSESINNLAGQLYRNWDKLLLDVEDNRQRVRFVRTQFPDSSLQGGTTSQEEKWEPVLASEAERNEQNVGMVIARKPAGKYDSEVENTVQAPGYAYVAPVGQANAYGHWNNGVWSWLPQYLILSQMLRGPSYPPIGMGDYGAYQQARQRGGVYYGQNRRESSGSLRRTLDRLRNDRFGNDRLRGGSSGGGFWQERNSDRNSPRASQGYRGSRYENRGSYSGSRYQNRSSGGFRSYSRGMGGGFRRGGRR